MLQKTRGIVLGTLRYRETSLIVRMYTEQLGLRSYLLNGVRTPPRKAAPSRMALLQPLTLLDLVVYQRESARAEQPLQRISELRCAYTYQHIPLDFHKSGMAMFMAEVLGRTIREEAESNPGLFRFLWDSLLVFDGLAAHFENFHLQFLLQLSRFLGFFPESADHFYEEVFDTEGWASVADAAEVAALRQLLHRPYAQPLGLPLTVRRSLLAHILVLYRRHVANFGELKSLGVLRELMR